MKKKNNDHLDINVLRRSSCIFGIDRMRHLQNIRIWVKVAAPGSGRSQPVPG